MRLKLSALVPALLLFPINIQATSITTTTLSNQQSFDFDTQSFGFLGGGDLYYLSQDCTVAQGCLPADTNKFWANNIGQRGLQDIGPVPLLSISSIPSSGYNQQGVLAVVGDSYISLAQTGEEGNFIFFEVTGLTNSSVTLDWIYSSTAPAATPEPGTLILLGGGSMGLAAAFRRKLASWKAK